MKNVKVPYHEHVSHTLKYSVVFLSVMIMAILATNTFLLEPNKSDELVIQMLPATTITSTPATTTPTIEEIKPQNTRILAEPLTTFQYIEIIDSCGPYYEGECVNMRSGPGTDYPAVLSLRNGIVFKVADTVQEKDGRKWYKIKPDDAIQYRNRLGTELYVAAEFGSLFENEGDKNETPENTKATTTKRIVVDRTQQLLSAYDGEEIFMQLQISTGLDGTPTPRGQFTVFRKTPSRYMQGPLLGISDQYYDLPGVPWDLYFTRQGGAIHGAYWHNSFGAQWSHGCVNLPPEEAKKLYMWAEIGTPVLVRD